MGTLKRNIKEEFIFLAGAIFNGEELRTKIYEFIQRNEYDYNALDVVKGFIMDKNGFYISYTMQICVTEFENELSELLNDGILLLNGDYFKNINTK